MKKGDLSINIIVIAAVALLVLVILSILLFRSGNDVNHARTCEGVGGICAPPGQSCSDISYNQGQSYQLSTNFECTGGGACCIKI